MAVTFVALKDKASNHVELDKSGLPLFFPTVELAQLVKKKTEDIVRVKLVIVK